MHNPRHKQVRICILDLCIYSLCALENCSLVLLFHGCENPRSASLCFKQYRNECEIRKSTNIFLQHADCMNWQFRPRLRNSKLKLSGLGDREGQAGGAQHSVQPLGAWGRAGQVTAPGWTEEMPWEVDVGQSKAKRSSGAGTCHMSLDVLFRFLFVFKGFLKGEDPTRRSLGRKAFSEAT